MNKKNFIFFLFVMIYCVSKAQEVPKILHFKDEIILNEQVWSIAQSADDRICLGTSDGLITFDGSNWEVVETSRQHIFRAVTADENGRIYTGSYGEFGYWKRDSLDRLQYFSLSKNGKNKVSTKEEIWHILQDKGTVYFQSFSTIYKYKETKVTEISTPGNIMFLQAAHDQLFLQQINGSIYELSQEDEFRLLPGTENFNNKKVVFILPFRDAELLIGTEQHGVFIWKENQIVQWTSPLQTDFKENQLNKGVQLPNGDLAFGTILNGVFILDDQGRLKNHLNKQKGLPDNTVLALVKGNDNNLWIGFDRGVAFVDLNNPLSFFQDVEGNLGTVYTASLFNGNLYLGTNHGVFFHQEREDFEAGFQFVKGTQGQVWELKVVDNQLLCGHNEGTFIISEDKAEKISMTNGGWVTLPLSDSADTLLQGTYSGLVLFSKNKSGEWVFSHRVNGFLEPVKEMVFDASGGIWLAHPIEGLHRVTLNSSRTEIQTIKKFSKQDGLPADRMINLLAYEGDIFVLSGKHWLRFDEKTSTFSEEGKIKDRSIKDLNGKIILNEDGSWFEILPTQVHYFSKPSMANEASEKEVLAISLVGGYENIVSLDPSRYLFCLKGGYAGLSNESMKAKTSHNFPMVRINQLEVLTDDSSTLIPLNGMDLELENFQNKVRFHFYQTIYEYPPTFRYRLEGLENNWSEWTNHTDKEYFNLAPGAYTFLVESEFSKAPATLKFRILPHWTQTPLAILSYLLAFGALVWGVQMIQKRKYIKAKERLETEQKRQLHEQQMKAKNEKLQFDLVNKSKELANSAANLAQKNEILLKIKNQLRQLKNSPNAQIPSKEYQQLLHIIDIHLTSEKDWELFEKNFNQVHEQFFIKLKAEFPELTPADLQLAAYLKMNLTSKEIAPLFHISLRGVENKRYRLRKKLGLSKEGSLVEFMMAY